jgi:hypothetical protein
MAAWRAVSSGRHQPATLGGLRESGSARGDVGCTNVSLGNIAVWRVALLEGGSRDSGLEVHSPQKSRLKVFKERSV